jgi:uncharacterized protein YabE (DUF348 family)
MNRKILILVISVAIISLGILFAIEIHKTVLVVDNDQEQAVTFWGFTVNDALKRAGIILYEGDEIQPAQNERISSGGTVSISRVSNVVIAADGKSQTLMTTERTPEKLFELAGIATSLDDLILANGQEIDPRKRLPYAQTHSLQVHRSTKITLNEDGQIHIINSHEGTLGIALWEVGIILNHADQLNPPVDTPLNGQAISATLNRSQEVVIQTQDGVVRTRVLAATVGEALSEAGMPLQGLNYSIPDEDVKIPDHGRIKVVQVSEQIILEQDLLPFGIKYTPLSDVPLDELRVVQVGEYGLKARRVRVTFEDGEEVSRSTENEWTAKEPKPRIVGYGTQVVVQSVSTPDGSIEYYRAIEAYATSYSPCRLGVDYCSSRTASGATLQKGVIGVIRSWYNVMKGQRVYITGYGFATIEDIGAGFSDRHWVDLGFSDDDWVSWSSYVTVYFLTPVPANILWILE